MTDVNVHINILSRMFKNEDIKNWIIKERPLLTAEVVTKCLTWCKKHKDWTWEEWSKIIFSDECSLERGIGAHRQWVFRTSQQKWDKEMIDSYKKDKDINIMI